MMIIAIIGSRDGLDWPKVTAAIRELVSRPDVGSVVSGGARGVDRIAESLGLASRKRVYSIRPDWKRYGKGAAMRRNADIVKAADEVHAFWDGKSRGTKGALEIARKLGKPVFVHEMGAP